MCQAYGRVTVAEVVDHVTPHKGDQALFWDRGNWQALCATHHNSDAQRAEKSGTIRRSIGMDGWPIETESDIEKTLLQKKRAGKGLASQTGSDQR